MTLLKKVIRRTLTYITALVLAVGYPVSVMAETQEPTIPPAETTTVEPAPEPAPVTEPEKPKLTYTYNPETEKWNSEKWQYNPTTGKYETPTVIEIKDTSSTEVEKSAETNVTLKNDIDSNATSGDAAVISNTTGGNATSGDAAVVANLLNVVNSSVETGENQKVASFTQDIMGDVKGDIMLYPMLLKAMLEAEAGANTSTALDVKNNFEIDNNVNLAAKSGNAAVTNNTTGGDATTGSAKAVANVVNILNSMIATQQSFIGTINIYGSLEGDILIAPDFIPQMIASNGDDSDNSSSTKLSTENTTNIVNNISTMAESGAAAVLGNTTGGNATTGSADTGVVIFNLTGHEIIAKNSLLVFVNVLGKWVGVIVDAPAGATSALIGNGVSKSEYKPDLMVNSESNHGITNTISVTAESGDAVVSGNTTGGDATTGSAAALANVANLSNSQFGISDWFGVLFINVFGNWYGSMGLETFYGDESEEVEAPSGPIQFIPKKSEQARTTMARAQTSSYMYVNTEPTQEKAVNNTVAVPESTEELAATLGKSTAKNNFDTGFDFRIFIVAGSLLAVGLSLLGLKRLFS